MTMRGRMAAALATFALLIGISPVDQAIADPAHTAPASVEISARSTMAIVVWSDVIGAPGYVVDYASEPTFATPQSVTSTTSIAAIPGLSPQHTYFARVSVLDPAAGDVRAWSSTVTFTTVPIAYAVAAPKLSLSASSTTSIDADWPGVKASGDVRYQTAMGTSKLTLTPKAVQTKRTATFSNLSRNTKYYVRVRATDVSGNPITAWSDTKELVTPDSLPLNVGTYNILCGNCSKGKASWTKRRSALVQSILAEDLDVLGVQEASIGKIRGGRTQYMDLIKRLGEPYKLTEYRRSVSPDNRIIYNAERVELIKQGVVKLPRGASKRFMAWAIFEQKSSKKRFFFSNTHLEPKNGRKAWNTRNRQARAIVSAIARLSDNLPVIAVGDYASTKWEKWGNKPYSIMEAAGYEDPLGNGYRTKSRAPGAFVEKRINTSYSSYNMYQRKARKFSNQVNGSNTDYIFVSDMRVSEYEVVVKVNSAGRFIGTIPSDHNLLRARVYLP